jgi:hypothetical protein
MDRPNCLRPANRSRRGEAFLCRRCFELRSVAPIAGQAVPRTAGGEADAAVAENRQLRPSVLAAGASCAARCNSER